LQKEKKLSESIKVFKNVLKLQENHPHATKRIAKARKSIKLSKSHFKTGKYHQSEDQFLEAMQGFEKALEINPFYEAAKKHLEQAKIQKRQEERKNVFENEYDTLKKFRDLSDSWEPSRTGVTNFETVMNRNYSAIMNHTDLVFRNLKNICNSGQYDQFEILFTDMYDKLNRIRTGNLLSTTAGCDNCGGRDNTTDDCDLCECKQFFNDFLNTDQNREHITELSELNLNLNTKNSDPYRAIVKMSGALLNFATGRRLRLPTRAIYEDFGIENYFEGKA
jgi:tetratricopeptide (TPR) repeat protein